MYLRKISLENFRSHLKASYEFSETTNLIVGPNGSGKTNLLEAIFFLSCGKSFRASSTPQVVSWEKTFTTVTGQVVSDSETNQFEVRFFTNQNGNFSRKFLTNNVEKTRNSYLGALPTVVFQPEDIRLVSGSPERRRDFLDTIFLTTEWRYAQALSQYHRALKHRNELLDQIRQSPQRSNELFYWNQSLVKNGEIIHVYRQKFIQHVNNFFLSHPHPEIQKFFLNYHPSIVTEAKLSQSYQLDLEKGYTHFGPHRDDFSFDSQIFPSPDQNLAHWGSRGQQRLVVFSSRLAQVDYLTSVFHHHPLLLLDDIFSELDVEHQSLVSDLCHHHQTFFTSADSQTLPANLPLHKPKICNIITTLAL